MLAAARRMGCVTPPPGASASGKGEHHLPGGLRNPSPGASASGKGEHRRGVNHKSQLAADIRRMGCVTSNPAWGCGGNTIPLVGCLTSLPVLAHGGGGTLPG